MSKKPDRRAPSEVARRFVRTLYGRDYEEAVTALLEARDRTILRALRRMRVIASEQSFFDEVCDTLAAELRRWDKE